MIRSSLSPNHTIKAADIFAGIGGIRLGFEQVFKEKIKFVFSNEIDKFASKTYQENFNENPLGDIRNVKIDDIPDFNILLAGFPCQAFSIAGKQKGFEDTRGTLFFYIAEILKLKKPDLFLLENVKHLISHKKGNTFKVIKRILTEDLNYNIFYKILNAKNFGLPQNRERIFIVGFKDTIPFSFPEPMKLSTTLKDILQNDVDERFFLSQRYLNGLKKHKSRHKSKGHGFGYEIIQKDGIANAIVIGGMGKERNLIKDRILSNCWKEGDIDYKKRNNEGIRNMTPKEWARLQGFPENFKFPVSNTQQYKQLANSVAVPVIRSIALEIKRVMREYN